MPRRITLPRSIRTRYSSRLTAVNSRFWIFCRRSINHPSSYILWIVCNVNNITHHCSRSPHGSRYLRIVWARVAAPRETRHRQGSEFRCLEKGTPRSRFKLRTGSQAVGRVERIFKSDCKDPQVFHSPALLISPKSTPRPGLSSAFLAAKGEGKGSTTTAACQTS